LLSVLSRAARAIERPPQRSQDFDWEDGPSMGPLNLSRGTLGTGALEADWDHRAWE